MSLITFLIRYSRASVTLAVIAGAISGVSNAGLLALFNTSLTNSGYSKATLIWSFAGLCLFLPATRFASEILLTRLAEGALFNLRMSLSRQILAAPLRHLEEVGVHRLIAALTDDVPTVTNALVLIPILCINIAITIGGLIYLGWLSWFALVVVLGFMVLGILSYQLPVIKALRYLRLAREDGDALHNHFQALTKGAKELKLHSLRRESFLSQVLESTAASYRKRNVTGMAIFTAAASWGQILVFVVVGLILFGLPMFKEIAFQTLTGYTITLLYLMMPLQVIMNTAPALGRANVALKKVEDLGLLLAAKGAEGGSTPGTFDPNWQRLELAGVTHAYHREGKKESFTLGPIDMTLRPGELVFLVGGNGSGKTTLAKLLSGLYLPETGEIRLNGRPVTDDNKEYYRQHFSMVFSDFYLFESLLGLDSPKLDDRARDYLAQLQLDHKVEIKDGVLSTTDLSQGQRKRLALLTAYMEDRPIYIFDEWAADQDPLFKEIFYYQLLPELKAKGKAIVVISHDDHYYNVADRIIKLEYGRVEYDESQISESLNFPDQRIRIGTS
ncbi:MAG TPA: cyclic peptide export ABC transporter [Blastocatellia bacterium]|nr:cyclic peptide export ABC transporter [Blastocatellia bacterium]